MGRPTGQNSVTRVSPAVSVHPPEVNQICSPSAVANLSRTSSILRGCEDDVGQFGSPVDERTAYAGEQALDYELHRYSVFVCCC